MSDELTKKEKEYIIKRLIDSLDSGKTSTKVITKNNVLKFSNKDFDLKYVSASEINMCKSIIRKLK